MIGHHGTSVENAKMILEEGFRKSSGKHQWFGEGVYFFDDDYIEARNWAVKVKKFERYAILQSEIDAQNPLHLHKSTEWGEFLKIKQRLLKHNQSSPFKNREITDAYVVEFMCQQIYKLKGVHIDVIICACSVGGYAWTAEITRIPRTQIQICVRELSSILRTELIEEVS